MYTWYMLLFCSPARRQAIDPDRQPLPAVYPVAVAEEVGATPATATADGARGGVSIDVPDGPVLGNSVPEEGVGNPTQPDAKKGSARPEHGWRGQHAGCCGCTGDGHRWDRL